MMRGKRVAIVALSVSLLFGLALAAQADGETLDPAAQQIGLVYEVFGLAEVKGVEVELADGSPVIEKLQALLDTQDELTGCGAYEIEPGDTYEVDADPDTANAEHDQEVTLTIQLPEIGFKWVVQRLATASEGDSQRADPSS